MGQISYQRILSPAVLANVRAMVRDLSANLWSNALSTPIRAAQQRGFQVEPLGKKAAYINGKRCVERKACWHDTGNKRLYLSIACPRVDFDICAWKLPDGRFLILPKKLADFRQTTFNPDESGHPGNASSTHHYREYIDNWSLLEAPGISKRTDKSTRP